MEDIEQDVFVCHVLDLSLELEFFDDLFDVGAEASEIFVEVGIEDLSVVGGSVGEPLKCPLAGVVVDVTGGLFESYAVPIAIKQPEVVLLVGEFLHDLVLRGFEERIEAAQDDHGENDISIFPTDVNVSEAIVCD